ncbi:MAG: tRNA (adenosine(37)-N6)-dimethylallyltransferase MiaA [Crocinitomicaceae bacterium]
MRDLTVILGPTASGKTELGCHLALELDAEIISADSRQIYRGMDIGTGKDIEEYTINGVEIQYHLIDIHEAGYFYNIAEYQLDFHKAFNEIQEKGKSAILCGGSGLYIETALEGNKYLGIEPDADRKKELENLDETDLNKLMALVPESIKKDLNALTKARKIRAILISEHIIQHKDWQPRSFEPFNYKIIGVKIDRDLRRKKISARLSHRLNNGMIEEAERLLDNGVTHEQMSIYGLEYKWLSQYLQKTISKKELFDGLNTAIHQFSKRQMTWFRRMEKKGYRINWVNADQSIEEKTAICKAFVQNTNR